MRSDQRRSYAHTPATTILLTDSAFIESLLVPKLHLGNLPEQLHCVPYRIPRDWLISAAGGSSVAGVPTTEQVNHIRRDADGRAWIDDTNVKVIELVQDYLAYGWSPEEMHLQHPGLSLAQIHAALSFYYDHQSEFDQQIQESLKRARTMVAEARNSPLRQKLRALGKL